MTRFGTIMTSPSEIDAEPQADRQLRETAAAERGRQLGSDEAAIGEVGLEAGGGERTRLQDGAALLERRDRVGDDAAGVAGRIAAAGSVRRADGDPRARGQV